MNIESNYDMVDKIATIATQENITVDNITIGFIIAAWTALSISLLIAAIMSYDDKLIFFLNLISSLIVLICMLVWSWYAISYNIQTKKQSNEEYRQTSMQTGTVKSIVTENSVNKQQKYVINIKTKNGMLTFQNKNNHEAKTMRKVIYGLRVNDHIQFKMEGFYHNKHMQQVRFNKINVTSSQTHYKSTNPIKVEQLFDTKD